MLGHTLIIIASELIGPIRMLIAAAMKEDEQEAKRALIILMAQGRKIALKKARGG